MAAADRRETTLVERIASDPAKFEFFQLVQILTRYCLDSTTEHDHDNSLSECITFRSVPSFEHPHSPVTGINIEADGPKKSATIEVTLKGLLGAQSVLPDFYTRLAIQRKRAGDNALNAFFDLFYNRLVAQYYHAWKKYRISAVRKSLGTREKEDSDLLTSTFMELLGLGKQESARLGFSALHAVFFAGLFLKGQPTANGLESILSHIFSVPVAVQQFAGRWMYLKEADQSRVGSNANTSAHSVLGQTLVIGSRLWDVRSKFRIRIGPLSMEDFAKFIPGGSASQQINSLTRFYAGAEFDFEVELQLKRTEVPEWRLGTDPHSGRLGWTCWTASDSRPSTDPSVIFVLES